MWGQRDSPSRSAAELVRGLDETWAFIETRLQCWTPEDCAMTFPDEWDGQKYDLSRSWVIYHVLEHDLHHGSEQDDPAVALRYFSELTLAQKTA